jgi:ATP-dependent Clp protease ATP-binding subunit ClpA
MAPDPLQRLIERQILSKLSVKIITGEIKQGDNFEIDVENNEFVINVIART